MHLWFLLTGFGDSSLLLPAAAFIFLWLLYRRQRGMAWAWAGLFGTACVLTALTKLAFMGWGIGIEALNFTGISGHSMLSGSVLPVLLALLVRERHQWRWLAAGLGALVAMLVGLSRLALDAHSPAEVIAGLSLGLCISGLFLALGSLRLPRLSPLLLALVIGVLSLQSVVGVHAPTHYLIQVIAAHLAGRDAAYQREDRYAPLRPLIPAA
ncbi:MAG: hypothetical protein GAK43_01583 [Stenotrophomonas maltophilia]|nr:MAG: hypothetical protein GAK43_01583 [Stenotrophomonas maltophilia]